MRAPPYTIAYFRSILPSPRIALILAALFFGPSAIGQSFTGFNPEQQVITTSTASAQSVHAVDLDGDGDGDADVLSASNTDNKIAWYENEGRSFPTLLDSYTGAAPGDWNRQYVILPTTLPATGNMQFQFLYTRGAGELGDLAIDDFCIF